ncbi:hypothetical protein D9M68_505150 [compost metagenome]
MGRTILHPTCRIQFPVHQNGEVRRRWPRRWIKRIRQYFHPMPGLARILQDTGIAGFAGTIVAKQDGHALRRQIKGAAGWEAVDLIEAG